jgi:hypothetical protein
MASSLICLKVSIILILFTIIAESAGWPFNAEITPQGFPFGLDVAIKALGNVGYHDAVPWMISGTMISAAYEMS